MRSFTNVRAEDLQGAVSSVAKAHGDGKRAAYAGGGSDLLGMLKERIVEPDIVVSLKRVAGHADVERMDGGVRIGGLMTLTELAAHPRILDQYRVLAEAAGSVATPQIRNVGTLAGNICQRPWCWYYRNGFPCYKAGGNQCFSATGENQFHAIFGGGPSYIVHPSDTAVALVALDATFELTGPMGERVLGAEEFFALPSVNPARENTLRDAEVLAAVTIPLTALGTRSTYHKVMDREAWTHAVVSAAVVLGMQGDVCRAARIVLGGVAPVPWRVPAAEQVLVGSQLDPSTVREAAQTAIAGARVLSRNAYKIPLTRGVVERTLLAMTGVD